MQLNPKPSSALLCFTAQSKKDGKRKLVQPSELHILINWDDENTGSRIFYAGKMPVQKRSLEHIALSFRIKEQHLLQKPHFSNYTGRRNLYTSSCCTVHWLLSSNVPMRNSFHVLGRVCRRIWWSLAVISSLNTAWSLLCYFPRFKNKAILAVASIKGQINKLEMLWEILIDNKHYLSHTSQLLTERKWFSFWSTYGRFRLHIVSSSSIWRCYTCCFSQTSATSMPPCLQASLTSLRWELSPHFKKAWILYMFILCTILRTTKDIHKGLQARMTPMWHYSQNSANNRIEEMKPIVN